MTTPPITRRAMLTALVGGAAAALVPGAARATGYYRPAPRYLQVYSFRQRGDAMRKAWEMRSCGFDHAAVFCARNGFYAVTVGKVAPGREHLVDRLKWQGKIPRDSFLTSGRAYVAQVSLGAYPPRHRLPHRPAPVWHGAYRGY